MTTTQTIPLNKLTHSDANVRRTGRTDGIEGLAASILAHGLRQMAIKFVDIEPEEGEAGRRASRTRKR